MKITHAIVYFRIGGNITVERRIRRMTQLQLAKKVGMSRGAIANIETGRQRVPLHTVMDIAVALKVGVGKLLKGCF